MPIFVTGGTGFLGLNLVRHLVSRQQPVRLLVRAKPNRLGLESELIEFARGDVTDAGSVLDAMRGCDQVYHLAGWVQISPWGMEAARSVNVEGTGNVCSAALRLGVRRLVHTSSIATIATGSPTQPADETKPWNLIDLRIPYYGTKREAETVILDHVGKGLDAVIVNPSYLVGPWDVKPSAGRMLIRIASGRVRAVPARGGINFVDVREAAAGHVLAMERGRTGERYFLGGENLSYMAFCRRAAAIAGVDEPRVVLPRAAMWPFAAAGSALGRLLPRQFRDLNLSVLNSAFLEHYATSRKACAELGFREVPIDRAIQDALEWFITHGYMPSDYAGSRHSKAAGRQSVPLAGEHGNP
jgi:dihydroflavonol-4-reductase